MSDWFNPIMSGMTNHVWVEEWLSAGRYRTYLRKAGGNHARALDLYEWCTRLNAQLLHDFAHLEVGLRNAYDNALIPGAVLPGDAHWLDDNSAQVVFPHSADWRTHKDIKAARQRAERGGVPPAPVGKVIAELSFGFWAYMTSERHEKNIWDPYLNTVYPSGSDRGKIHSGLTALNWARNRVAHHEPTDTAEANNTVRRIRRYATYLSTDLADYITDSSEVPALIKARP